MLLSKDIIKLCALNLLRNATAVFPLNYTVLYPDISLIILLSLKIEFIINVTNTILWYVSTPLI